MIQVSATSELGEGPQSSVLASSQEDVFIGSSVTRSSLVISCTATISLHHFHLVCELPFDDQFIIH